MALITTFKWRDITHDGKIGVPNLEAQGKSKFEIWEYFRSELPVSPIFPSYIMSNKTHERNEIKEAIANFFVLPRPIIESNVN